MRKINLILPVSMSAVAIALFVFIASSCHKTKNNTITEDTGYATDQATTEKSFNDVQTIADQASTVPAGSNMGYKTTNTTALGCATVTKTTGTITVDFGATDCLCHDGRTRRGQIIVTYTGTYADAGSKHTITFNNFYQDDNKITGTKTVTNMGNNSLGQPYFNVTIDGSVTLASGGTVSSNWTRLRTWTVGYNTPNDFTDDVYSISGTGSMTRANGTVVSIDIPTLTPLVVAYGCKWIESGTITYTLPGGLSRSLNYGTTPVCDDQATLSLATGLTKAVTLP
jgi:hypothetical protein